MSVKGKITHKGPIKTDAGRHGSDIVYLTPEMLPVGAFIDPTSEHENWVRVITPHFTAEGVVANSDPNGIEGWVELPRFTPDGEEPPVQPGDISTVEIDWTNRTIKVRPQ